MSADLLPWSSQQAGVGGGSSQGPALCSFQNRLYAAWKGAGSDDRMFWSSFDGSAWSVQQPGVGGGSSTGPTLSVFQDRLFAAWKGAGSDDRMFWSSFDGAAWSPQQVGIGGGSSESPAIAAFGSRLYAVWKGDGGDNRLFWSSFDGRSWSEQLAGVGGGTSGRPGLATFRNRLYAAWRGGGSDERMFWSSFDGAAWSPQQVGIGGGSDVGPSLAVYSVGVPGVDDRLFAAWKGAGGDQRMFWSFFDGATWTVQEPGIGGGTSVRPMLAPFGTKLYAGWKGVAGDDRMFWSSLDIDRSPIQPVLVSPPKGASGLIPRPQFLWQDPGVGTVRAAQNFLLVVTTPEHPLFDAWVIRQTTSQPFFNPTQDLAYSQTYIWQVTAFTGVGTLAQTSSAPAQGGPFTIEPMPASGGTGGGQPPPPPQPTCFYELVPPGGPSDTVTIRIYGGGFKPNEKVDILGSDNNPICFALSDQLGLYSVETSFLQGTDQYVVTFHAHGETSNLSSPIVSFAVNPG